MQTPPTTVRRYYCSPADNAVEGPFELVELAGLLRAKHITAETPVLVEGEETWLQFQDQKEYAYALEIPQEVINRHVAEKNETQVSSFSPRKLMTFALVMGPPVLLFLGYRFFRLYLSYHLGHDMIDSGATTNAVDTPADP